MYSANPLGLLARMSTVYVCILLHLALLKISSLPCELLIMFFCAFLDYDVYVTIIVDKTGRESLSGCLLHDLEDLPSFVVDFSGAHLCLLTIYLISTGEYAALMEVALWHRSSSCRTI